MIGYGAIPKAKRRVRPRARFGRRLKRWRRGRIGYRYFVEEFGRALDLYVMNPSPLMAMIQNSAGSTYTHQDGISIG